MEKDRPKRIVLSNSYGAPNAGDQAILLTMIEALKKRSPNIQIDVLTRWPKSTRKRHPGVRAVRSGIILGFLDTCKSIRQADILILGGGGIIQDSTSLGSLIMHLSRAALARFFATPFIGVGLGAGPITTKLGRWLTKVVLNTAEGLYVRSEKSAELLVEIGVDKNKIVVLADIALGMDYDENVKNEEAYQQVVKLNKKSKHLIGLSLRPEVGLYKRYFKRSSFYEGFLRQVATACDELVKKIDAQFVFVSINPKQDDKIGREIQKWMQNGNQMMLLSGALNPKVIAAAVRELDLLIGMRLHSAIFAAGYGVPFLAFGYAPKIFGFSESLGSEQYAIQLQEFNPEKLIEQVEEILEHREEISSDIKKKLPELQARARSNMEAVFEFLKV